MKKEKLKSKPCIQCGIMFWGTDKIKICNECMGYLICEVCEKIIGWYKQGLRMTKYYKDGTYNIGNKYVCSKKCLKKI